MEHCGGGSLQDIYHGKHTTRVLKNISIWKMTQQAWTLWSWFQVWFTLAFCRLYLLTVSVSKLPDPVNFLQILSSNYWWLFGCAWSSTVIKPTRQLKLPAGNFFYVIDLHSIWGCCETGNWTNSNFFTQKKEWVPYPWLIWLKWQ